MVVVKALNLFFSTFGLEREMESCDEVVTNDTSHQQPITFTCRPSGGYVTGRCSHFKLEDNSEYSHGT